MTPEEASELLQKRAMMLIECAHTLQKNGHENLSKDEILLWCLTIMNLYAESLWNMGDIINKLGENFDFKIETISEPKNQNSQNKYNLDEPPFDKDFFKNL